MINFIKWLFNCSEYGYMTYDPHGLYRRRRLDGSVWMKNYEGWQRIHDHLWMRFRPFKSDVQSAAMPNDSAVSYSIRQRDRMGEREFSAWLQSHRRAALEQMIRAKYK